MTAQEERLIGRLTKAVGWGALCLIVAGSIAAARVTQVVRQIWVDNVPDDAAPPRTSRASFVG